jgi:hypothetical protein
LERNTITVQNGKGACMAQRKGKDPKRQEEEKNLPLAPRGSGGSGRWAAGFSGQESERSDAFPLPCLNSNISDGHPQSTPPDLPQELSPYHQKSAFALSDNVERFCRLYGIENCGFLTLTFPDNVTDHKEASRRFDNMNRRYLRSFYGEWIWDRERQKRGAWHYHIIIQCKGDIRTNFDWDEYMDWISDHHAGKRRRLKTGNKLLRSLWELNNRAFPSYGFGRVELLPIRSTSDAVAKYVGKYISKQIGQRPEEDKGVRLTSHSKGFVASSPKFSWNSEGAKKWRSNLCLFALHACQCTDHDDFLEKAPHRWAYKFRKDIMTYDQHFNELYPDKAPF